MKPVLQSLRWARPLGNRTVRPGNQKANHLHTPTSGAASSSLLPTILKGETTPGSVPHEKSVSSKRPYLPEAHATAHAESNGARPGLLWLAYLAVGGPGFGTARQAFDSRGLLRESHFAQPCHSQCFRFPKARENYGRPT